MHFVPQLVQLPGIALLEITDDPTVPPSAKNLDRVFTATGKARLMLSMTSEQVREQLDELTNSIFLQVSCENRKDAEDVINFVHDRSA